MAATTPSTFVIFLQSFHSEPEGHVRVEKFTIDNAATNEQLTVRNAMFKMHPTSSNSIHYVEIVRHPRGAEAKMRDWVKGRAYYKNNYKDDDDEELDEEKLIWIKQPTIG